MVWLFFQHPFLTLSTTDFSFRMWPASNIVSGQRLVEINTTDWWSASWKQHKHVIGRSGLFSLQKLRHCWTERFLRKRVQLNVLGTNRSQHYRQGANVPEASCLSTLTWVGVPLFPTRLFASCEAQQMERNTFKRYFKFLLIISTWTPPPSKRQYRHIHIFCLAR